MSLVEQELRKWLARDPEAGQAVTILAQHGQAILAAIELAEAHMHAGRARGTDRYAAREREIRAEDAYRAALKPA